MDRQIPVVNRLIHNKFYQKQCLRHKKKLQYIRNKSHSTYYVPFLSQSPHSSQQSTSKNNHKCIPFVKQSKASYNNHIDKVLQIEKKNIILFNRIADIIRKKPTGSPTGVHPPKFILPKSQICNQIKNKKQKQIQLKNQQIHKRLANQKPIIQNKDLIKDRKRQLKYLSFMGRYPYKLNRVVTQPNDLSDLSEIKQSKKYRNASQKQLLINKYYRSQPQKQQQMTNIFQSPKKQNQEQQKNEEKHRQIFKHKTNQFQIIIAKDCVNFYTFLINDLNGHVHKFQMNVHKFRKEIESCNYDYLEMIKKLRLNTKGKMKYDFKKGSYSSNQNQ